MEEIVHQLIGSLSRYFQGFIRLRCDITLIFFVPMLHVFFWWSQLIAASCYHMTLVSSNYALPDCWMLLAIQLYSIMLHSSENKLNKKLITLESYHYPFHSRNELPIAYGSKWSVLKFDTPWSKYMAQSPKGRLIQGLYKPIHGNRAIYFYPGVLGILNMIQQHGSRLVLQWTWELFSMQKPYRTPIAMCDWRRWPAWVRHLTPGNVT